MMQFINIYMVKRQFYSSLLSCHGIGDDDGNKEVKDDMEDKIEEENTSRPCKI